MGRVVEAKEMVAIKQFCFIEKRAKIIKKKHKRRKRMNVKQRRQKKIFSKVYHCLRRIIKWTNSSRGSKCESSRERQARGGETEGSGSDTVRASKDEKWISSWQQIGVSCDKCPPLYPLREYSQVLQTQGDLLWIGQSVAGSRKLLTVTGVRFQLPPARCHCGLFIHSEFTQIFKRVKRTPRRVDMNQAFCADSDPCWVVKRRGINLHSMREITPDYAENA